jgi:hypothetical protein
VCSDSHCSPYIEAESAQEGVAQRPGQSLLSPVAGVLSVQWTESTRVGWNFHRGSTRLDPTRSRLLTRSSLSRCSGAEELLVVSRRVLPPYLPLFGMILSALSESLMGRRRFRGGGVRRRHGFRGIRVCFLCAALLKGVAVMLSVVWTQVLSARCVQKVWLLCTVCWPRGVWLAESRVHRWVPAPASISPFHTMVANAQRVRLNARAYVAVCSKGLFAMESLRPSEGRCCHASPAELHLAPSLAQGLPCIIQGIAFVILLALLQSGLAVTELANSVTEMLAFFQDGLVVVIAALFLQRIDLGVVGHLLPGFEVCDGPVQEFAVQAGDARVGRLVVCTELGVIFRVLGFLLLAVLLGSVRARRFTDVLDLVL